MAGLSNTNNHINTLIGVGNDAHSHLYEAVFEGGSLGDINTSLSVRCSGFQRPETTQDSYPVRYITAYIDRPKAKVNVTRNFTLKFRLDAYWDVYKALLTQQSLTSNPAHYYAISDITALMDAGLLFNVSINVIKDLNDVIGNPQTSDNASDATESLEEAYGVTKLFTFKNCWIEELRLSGFSGSDSNPVTVDAKIDFLQMEDWQSGITGDPTHGSKITLSESDSE